MKLKEIHMAYGGIDEVHERDEQAPPVPQDRPCQKIKRVSRCPEGEALEEQLRRRMG